jgi:hypothetical protein
MCSTPAQPASENDESPISTGRGGVSGGGEDPRVTLRARKLGASRGVQSRGVPANGTLLFDFDPSGLAAQRVTVSFCDGQARKRWDNHPTKVCRRVTCSG